MDVETLTSATEFGLTVIEWLAGIDADETQAAGFTTGSIHGQPSSSQRPSKQNFWISFDVIARS